MATTAVRVLANAQQLQSSALRRITAIATVHADCCRRGNLRLLKASFAAWFAKANPPALPAPPARCLRRIAALATWRAIACRSSINRRFTLRADLHRTAKAFRVLKSETWRRWYAAEVSAERIIWVETKTGKMTHIWRRHC